MLHGRDALLVGTLPTPGIAVLAIDQKADAGFVISASHNPYQDNGIKLFSCDGYKLPDEEEAEIEKLMAGGTLTSLLPTAGDIGKSFRIDDALERYIVFCKKTFPADLDLKGMRIVLDCANGATYKAAPVVFAKLGAHVTTLHSTPNGLNINARCGSQHTEALREQVLAERADIGLAFDGDGDRLIVVDETGEELTGDHILAICAKDLKERGKLKNNLAVGTVMSNFGLHATMRKLGIELGCSAVGDRYVLEMMKEKGGILGAESSGHMIFLDKHTTGDGIMSALAAAGGDAPHGPGSVGAGVGPEDVAAAADQRGCGEPTAAGGSARGAGGDPGGGEGTGPGRARAGALFRHPDHVPRDGRGADGGDDDPPVRIDRRGVEERTRIDRFRCPDRKWSRRATDVGVGSPEDNIRFGVGTPSCRNFIPSGPRRGRGRTSGPWPAAEPPERSSITMPQASWIFRS